MGSVSIWHWIVVLVILFLFIPVIVSPIVWFATKDPNNKVLKILYWIRFALGLLALVSIIPMMMEGGMGGAETIGAISGRLVVVWLLMRRWAKPKKEEDVNKLDSVEEIKQ